MPKLLPRTRSICPPEIDKAIQYFCERLSPTTTPVYLPTNSPPHGALWQCHQNVKRAVKKLGGTPCSGWLLWLQPHVFVTAEQHIVRHYEGGFTDHTPQYVLDANGDQIAFECVLFLPAAAPPKTLRRFEANRYLLLNTSPLARAIVDTLHEASAVMVSHHPMIGMMYGRQCQARAEALLEQFYEGRDRPKRKARR